MGIKVQSEFIAESTVRIRAYIYDDDDALVDPTAITVTIDDPSGTTEVDDQEMTALEDTDGIYDYYYNTDADSAKGFWNGRVKVVDGTGDTAKTSFGTFSFKVKQR
jgi:uncharacterized protein YfaS (alpha-2-macroglobulin family)